MNRDPLDLNLPLGYRWATAEETEDWTVRGFDLLGQLWVPIHFDNAGNLLPRKERQADLAVLDDRNAKILAERLAALDEREGARVGDFVIFADDVVRQFSHDWDETGLQTSDGGSWYLGLGYLSFSGSLYRKVKRDTLTPADEIRSGTVWFFHHDWAQAHRAVHVTIPLRVYRCSLTSKEAS